MAKKKAKSKKIVKHRKKIRFVKKSIKRKAKSKKKKFLTTKN